MSALEEAVEKVAALLDDPEAADKEAALIVIKMSRSLVLMLAKLELLEMANHFQRATTRTIEKASESRPARRKGGAWLREMSPEAQADLERREEEINGRMWTTIADALSDYRENLRMEWTRELLDSFFALPDGTRVAWGKASSDQHAIRIDMLLGNAAGNLETAARHQVAIETLMSNGVSCLNELEGVSP